MARVVVCVPPLFGPINSTRQVVNDLRRNGHIVYFVGVPECAAILGDDYFIPVFSELFPSAESPAMAQHAPVPPPVALLDRIRGARRAYAIDRTLLDRLAAGRNEGFETAIRTANPDVVVIAANVWYAIVWALLSHRFNIPAIYLNSTLHVPENSTVPPVHSRLRPPNGLCGPLLTWLAWKVHNVQKRILHLRPRLLANMSYAALIADLAHAVQFPAELLYENESQMRTRAPEIVLMPEVFDFPHPAWPERYYCAASVDLFRPECAFPWERLDSTLPVIYCALGTLPLMAHRRYLRFYACVVEAFTAFCEHYQLVLAVGTGLDPAGFGPHRRNVTVVQHAPQIALLRRSALAITHGGPNSVKECIALAVPMLLYPLAIDQFGITARAVYHGIALQGNVARVRAVEMRAKIRRLLEMPSYRMQVERMRCEFARAESDRPAAGLIETFLSHGSRQASAARPTDRKVNPTRP